MMMMVMRASIVFTGHFRTATATSTTTAMRGLLCSTFMSWIVHAIWKVRIILSSLKPDPQFSGLKNCFDPIYIANF